MRRRLLLFCTCLCVPAIIMAAAAQQQQTFTSGVVLVPINVRVISSKTGKAVTDLKAEDFTLLEDGVAQPIRLFEVHPLTPEEPPEPGAGNRIQIRRTPFDVVPQNNRVFLFVLGRGRLQEPSGAVDALIRFVRQRLLPQDRVAVFAYDRATDFTTDHESIAKLLERFKRVQYNIDMDVRLQVESGLSALYGSKKLPKKKSRTESTTCSWAPACSRRTGLTGLRRRRRSAWRKTPRSRRRSCNWRTSTEWAGRWRRRTAARPAGWVPGRRSTK